MSEPVCARMLYINPSESLRNRLKIFWTCLFPYRQPAHCQSDMSDPAGRPGHHL